MIEAKIKTFLEVWEKRKTGELSPVDMRLTYQSCGVQVMGDDAVQFTKEGLICNRCLDNRKHGTTTSSK
jgi:hypothetical protein